MKDTGLNKKKDGRKLLIFMYLGFFVLLSICYAYYINVYYESVGFEYEYNRLKFVVSFLVLIGFVGAIPVDGSVRSFFLNILLTAVIVPSLVMYSFAGRGNYASAVVCLAFVVVYFSSMLPFKQVRLMHVTSRDFLSGISLAVALFLACLVYFVGVGKFNLDFNLVYELRDQIEEEMPGIFGYLIPLFSKIVIPTGVVLSVYYKRFIATLYFIISSFILFGLTTHKGVIIYPIVALVVFISVNRFQRYSSFLIVVYIAVIFALFLILTGAASDGSLWSWYPNLLLRRALFIPALLDYHYIDFFSENPRYLWATSRISLGLIPNPYGILAPNLIGETYFGSVEAAANVGFIGSGFAQAGVGGVVAYSIGAGLTIAFLNAYQRQLGLALLVSMMSGQIMTMYLATDFLTLLLTHGLLVSLLFIAAIRPPGTSNSVRTLPAVRA